ncbi:MAG: hypothetical protein OEZ22_06880 [Spirochaetia bacterium]|nr:hypothetical protein [Spirochaetia bacterium]
MIPYKKLTVIFFALYLTTDIYSEDILKLSKDKNTYNLSPYLYFYRDSTEKLKLNEIINLYKDNKFIKNTSYTPSFGFTNDAVWGKFSIQDNFNLNKEWLLLFDLPLTDKIDLFLEKNDGSYKEYILGTQRDINSRYIFYRKNILSLDSDFSLPKNIYIRIQALNPLDVPLRIISKDEFLNTNRLEAILMGIYYGITLVMIIYNFIIYLSLKDKNYLYYVLYILLYALVQTGLDGYLSQFLYAENNLIAHKLRSSSAGAAIFFSIYFTISFLNLKENQIKIYNILKILSGLCIVQILIANINFSIGHRLAFFLMFLGIILFILASVSQLKTNNKARYFFGGWIFFLIMALIYSFKTIGVYVPFLTTYGMQLGSLWVIIFLSMALAQSIKEMDKEKEKKTIETLKSKQILKEKEIEFKKINIKNELVERDLAVTRNILQGLIPQGKIHNNFYSFFAISEKIGGDFYDIFNISANQTAVFISSLSKRSVPAATLCVMIKTILNNLRTHQNKNISTMLFEPSKLISYIYKNLEAHIKKSEIKILYGIYDKKSKVFKYINKNYYNPMILSKDKFKDRISLSFSHNEKSSKSKNQIKQKISASKHNIKEIKLNHGDKLFFYNRTIASFISLDKSNFLDIVKQSQIYDLFREIQTYEPYDFFQKIKENISTTNTKFIANDICFITLNA